MAQFRPAVVTKEGTNLIIESLATDQSVIFTKFESGAGSYAGSENLENSTSLKDLKNNYPISNVKKVGNDTLIITAVLNNENVSVGYNMTEYGVYGKIGSGQEVLITITTAITADYMPPKSVAPSSVLVDLYIKLSGASDVKFEYTVPDGVYTPLKEFNLKTQKLEQMISKYASILSNIVPCELEATKWQQNGQTFKQEVTLDGMSADYNCVLVKSIPAVASISEIKTYNKAFHLIFAGETATNKVIFYAYKKPERDFPVGLKGV